MSDSGREWPSEATATRKELAERIAALEAELQSSLTQNAKLGFDLRNAEAELAQARAEIARLSAPVSDAEWREQLGDVQNLPAARFRLAANAILAARREGK